MMDKLCMCRKFVKVESVIPTASLYFAPDRFAKQSRVFNLINPILGNLIIGNIKYYLNEMFYHPTNISLYFPEGNNENTRISDIIIEMNYSNNTILCSITEFYYRENNTIAFDDSYKFENATISKALFYYMLTYSKIMIQTHLDNQGPKIPEDILNMCKEVSDIQLTDCNEFREFCNNIISSIPFPTGGPSNHPMINPAMLQSNPSLWQNWHNHMGGNPPWPNWYNEYMKDRNGPTYYNTNKTESEQSQSPNKTPFDLSNAAMKNYQQSFGMPPTPGSSIHDLLGFGDQMFKRTEQMFKSTEHLFKDSLDDNDFNPFERSGFRHYPPKHQRDTAKQPNKEESNKNDSDKDEHLFEGLK